jgi:hypothetical protein
MPVFGKYSSEPYAAVQNVINGFASRNSNVLSIFIFPCFYLHICTVYTYMRKYYDCEKLNHKVLRD